MQTQKNVIKNRHVGAQNKQGPHNDKALLQSIDVNEPFVFWAMDSMGPLPETSRGNKHLLVIMNHFTKWCEAFPTKDQTAFTIAEVLVLRVFSRFGPPAIIHSDQVRNFKSHLMHEIGDIMGIHKSRTTAYHPQCDGVVERQNWTSQHMLSSFISQHQDDWDNWVSLAVYAFNTSCNESNGFSPYEMLFGRDARTPLDLDLCISLKNPCIQSEYSQSLRKAITSIKRVAQQSLGQRRTKQSQHQSSTSHWSPLPPGSSVWLRRPKSWKFGRLWTGPYESLRQKGVNYTLISNDGKNLVVHHNQVKPYAVPAAQGTPYCPVLEFMDATLMLVHQQEHSPP